MQAKLALLACGLYAPWAGANPSGGTVVQGSATITGQGAAPATTINQTSSFAQINWTSFNIDAGQTVAFNQPSSSSVVWNRINDPNPSQLLGSLTANGYVVLQNSSGFVVGGNATLKAHGLVMTTSPAPVPDLSSGGPWQFNALPPNASIINYGAISTDKTTGNGVFLIAADIENHGTITAMGGDIGLYSGKEVLLSSRSNGRGLSARVTLPSGSVDNEGQLIADAGTIIASASVVNQGGLAQANTVNQANGVVELLASDSLTLGSSSSISATGDKSASSASQAGCVIIKSDGTFSDASGSTVSVAGQQSGPNGLVEVFGIGATKTTLKTLFNTDSAASFQSAGGLLLFNPNKITISASVSTPTSSSPNLNNSDLASYSKIALFASGSITLNSSLSLAASTDPNARLSLTAANNISLSSADAISCGANWSVDLSAGPRGLSSEPASGADSILLSSTSYIATQDGDINLWAARDIIVNPAISTSSGIRTLNGGNISVTAEYGDVNSGANYNGYNFTKASPYYNVSSSCGGISTVNGGDVDITAGGNVISYLPVQSSYSYALHDAGSGAFGARPGNVSITAGGNVYGHYVVANGTGDINAGADVGIENSAADGFAISLVKGSWNVSAPNGSIYLQDIRNPNGVFNTTKLSSDNTANHIFDYAPDAAVSLSANTIEITGYSAPHKGADTFTVPFIYPPSLTINAGSGGFVLGADVILFPSPNGELKITTTDGGSFQGYQGSVYELSMSDSSATRWLNDAQTFSDSDHAATPPELNNPNPVQLTISGSIDNIDLRTTKATHITVDGDTYNFNFLGQNLHPGDTTYINVAGSISYPATYSFVPINSTISSVDPAYDKAWDTIFSLLVDNDKNLYLQSDQLPLSDSDLTIWAMNNLRLILGNSAATPNPGFVYYYDSSAKSYTLGYQGQMSSTVFKALDSDKITILKLDDRGNVEKAQDAHGNWYILTETVSFVPTDKLASLYTASQTTTTASMWGLQLCGPGQFNVSAHSIDLESSEGILSKGNVDNPYPSLGESGANLTVTTDGDLNLLAAAIASYDGGDLTVKSGGSISLSRGDLVVDAAVQLNYMGSGIYTSGGSDVSVSAVGDINIGSSRIATFDGGNIDVESSKGNVNAGNGANRIFYVVLPEVDSVTGQTRFVSDQASGSGIIASSPKKDYWLPGSSGQPGNIVVTTPEGDIVSTLGGIKQVVANGTVNPSSTITLAAGSEGHVGNVELGAGGVVGGTVNINANGNISGLILASGNANVTAAQNFSGTLLAGGVANVSATAGTVSGTIIGISAANVSGGGGVVADVQSQNASVGGTTEGSTLGNGGNATATSQAAAQQTAADTQNQLAHNTASDDDDEKKKRKGSKAPFLTRHVGRVTVLLPKS